MTQPDAESKDYIPKGLIVVEEPEGFCSEGFWERITSPHEYQTTNDSTPNK